INNFKDFIRPFDTSKDLLIRVGLIDKSILMIDMDHKVADGYSFGILIKELDMIYNNESLENLPIQYSDYAIDYDKKINIESFSDEIYYYKTMFNE
ncbi:hypothetical protein H8356DRAFT_913670, partial [Neocallimastix lanati (nom. inval.)]